MTKEEALAQEAKEVAAAQQPGYAAGYGMGWEAGFAAGRAPGVQPQPVTKRLTSRDFEHVISIQEQRIVELEAVIEAVYHHWVMDTGLCFVCDVSAESRDKIIHRDSCRMKPLQQALQPTDALTPQEIEDLG